MKQGNGKMIAAEVVKLLEESRKELEHYRKALANDQRQMVDHLEALRQELQSSLSDMRKAFSDTRTLTVATSKRLLEKVQYLQDRLVHLPSNEPELLKKWLTGIKRTLNEIIQDLGGENIFSERLARLVDQLHRLRIKADILKLKVRLGAMDIRDVVVGTRKSFRDQMASVRTYAAHKEDMIGKRLKHFRQEVSEAYDHLSKALASK